MRAGGHPVKLAGSGFKTTLKPLKVLSYAAGSELQEPAAMGVVERGCLSAGSKTISS